MMLKKIGKSNKNFYITINSQKTGVRSLLYSGKWVNFEDVTFVDSSSSSDVSGFDYGDFTDLGLSYEELQDLINSGVLNGSGVGANLSTNPNTNCLIFLEEDVDVGSFDDYIDGLGVKVYLRKPAGNTDTLTYLYFLLNVTPAVMEDMKTHDGVKELIPIPFNIGVVNNNAIIDIRDVEGMQDLDDRDYSNDAR